jgi:4-oxalmesaconate hydratase
VIIDSHGHYTQAPPRLRAYRGFQFSRLNRPSKGSINISDELIVQSLQKNLKQMAELGIDCILFSPGAGAMGHDVGGELVSRYWTETNNELISRVCKLFPDKFIPVCQLPQSPGVSPKNCIPELERCVTDLGFVGCNINPDVSGGNQPFTPSLRDEWWYPLWEKMVELDVPAVIHASSTQNPALHSNGAHYVNVDTAAVVELCNSRVFEHFPTLKLIVPHGGGAIPFQWARHRSLHVEEKRPPFEEVVKHLYFDTTVYDQVAMELLIKRMGADNVIFATEMFGTGKSPDPLTGKGFDHTVELVKNIDWLTDEDRYKIFEGNARKLYTRVKWPVPAPSHANGVAVA